MLFSPTTLILASQVQQQHYAGARLDGPTVVTKPRRRGFFGAARGVARPIAPRRSLAAA
ncbi:MAG: hypothetical protein ABWZ98_05940 [Nakamurella sp.]